MSNTRKPTFADIMADPKNGRTQTTLPVCFSEDLNTRLGELESERQSLASDEEARAKAKAEGKTAGRRIGTAPSRTSKDVEAEAEALVADNPTAFYDVVIQAALRSDWVDMKAENPPQQGNDVDENFGVRWDACVPLIVKMCLLDPEPTDKVIGWLDANMVKGEWDRIASAAYMLTEGVRSIPKSRSTTSSQAVSSTA